MINIDERVRYAQGTLKMYETLIGVNTGEKEVPDYQIAISLVVDMLHLATREKWPIWDCWMQVAVIVESNFERERNGTD